MFIDYKFKLSTVEELEQQITEKLQELRYIAGRKYSKGEQKEYFDLTRYFEFCKKFKNLQVVLNACQHYDTTQNYYLTLQHYDKEN